MPPHLAVFAALRAVLLQQVGGVEGSSWSSLQQLDCRQEKFEATEGL
jgi:hypothetical protein